MRVVIDTNCLIASIPPRGEYYWLYEAFEAEKFEWLISNEILTEYLWRSWPVYILIKLHTRFILLLAQR